MESKIIAIASQKGGTGKTTTARNLGYALAKSGSKVLLADMDPQSNLTISFGIDAPEELEMPMHLLLERVLDERPLPEPDEYIQHGSLLDIIPCNINLSVTEINLRNEMGSERTLSELLEPLRPAYDYIIIDTNPYLGLLTINALAACDRVIIPVSPEYWSATGLTDLLQTISKVRRKINPRIVVDGIVMTMCELQTLLFRDVKNMLDEYCADRIRIFNSLIPRTTKVGRANYSSLSIIDLDARSKAAQAYSALAKEVMEIGHTSKASA